MTTRVLQTHGTVKDDASSRDEEGYGYFEGMPKIYGQYKKNQGY